MDKLCFQAMAVFQVLEKVRPPLVGKTVATTLTYRWP